MIRIFYFFIIKNKLLNEFYMWKTSGERHPKIRERQGAESLEEGPRSRGSFSEIQGHAILPNVGLFPFWMKWQIVSRSFLEYRIEGRSKNGQEGRSFFTRR
jgi:hypothetical protein